MDTSAIRLVARRLTPSTRAMTTWTRLAIGNRFMSPITRFHSLIVKHKYQFAKLGNFAYFCLVIETGQFSTPGQLLRALLDERGWTQRVLAVVAGIEEPTISKL